MQVKSIAEYSAIFSPFIKLPFVFQTLVLSIFEWPLKTGFTVVGKEGLHALPDFPAKMKLMSLKHSALLQDILMMFF